MVEIKSCFATLLRLLLFCLFLVRVNGAYIFLDPRQVKSERSTERKKKRSLYASVRGWNGERNGHENSKNSGMLDSWRQKTRNDASPIASLVLCDAAFFLGCYFLVALRAALFSRVPNMPCDPRSKYRHRYM